MRTMWIAGLLFVAACGKSGGDPCEQVWDKMAPVMGEMAKQAGNPLPADAKDKFVKECRAGDRMKKDPVFDCVLKASGNEAVTRCMTGGIDAYKRKSQVAEAKMMLTMLGKHAETAYAEHGAFPVGKAGPAPAGPCCDGPDQRCAVADDLWASDPVWSALGFYIGDPTRFTYSYESDGKTATATAVGDLDCDGTSITYKLEISADADGTFTRNLVEPSLDTD